MASLPPPPQAGWGDGGGIDARGESPVCRAAAPTAGVRGVPENVFDTREVDRFLDERLCSGSFDGGGDSGAAAAHVADALSVVAKQPPSRGISPTEPAGPRCPSPPARYKADAKAAPALQPALHSPRAIAPLWIPSAAVALSVSSASSPPPPLTLLSHGANDWYIDMPPAYARVSFSNSTFFSNAATGAVRVIADNLNCKTALLAPMIAGGCGATDDTVGSVRLSTMAAHPKWIGLLSKQTSFVLPPTSPPQRRPIGDPIAPSDP